LGAFTSNKGLLAIEVRPNGVAVAYNPGTSPSKITICEFHPYQSEIQPGDSDLSELKTHLSKIVTTHNLRKSYCTLILHPDYYHLTLIDTPEVPEAEHKEAVRWQMKDIVEYPLEDVAIDIFHPGGKEGNLKKTYVIATQNSSLQKIINIIQNCELLPAAVDIREFAMRNLASKLAKAEETIGFLDVFNDKCIMVTIQQNNIQFVRHIPTGLNSIKNGDYSQLTTEIKRSFNYCETECGLPLPTEIFMPPMADTDNEIPVNIEKNINKKTSVIRLQDIVELEASADQQIEFNCWVAIGGALRNTV